MTQRIRRIRNNFLSTFLIHFACNQLQKDTNERLACFCHAYIMLLMGFIPRWHGKLYGGRKNGNVYFLTCVSSPLPLYRSIGRATIICGQQFSRVKLQLYCNINRTNGLQNQSYHCSKPIFNSVTTLGRLLLVELTNCSIVA